MAHASARESDAGNESVAGVPDAGAGTFSSLRVRNFRLLLLGTTLDNMAMWIQQVTMSWLVYDITGSGAMLGLINLSRSAATVGLAPVSGVIIDRFPRRTLMLWICVWLMVLNGLLGVILLTGNRDVWFLFVFAFLGGVAQAIDIPLRQTVVFVLVPRKLASNAVALLQTGWGLMRSIGPAVGGLLIAAFGPGGNFLIQALAYVLIMFNTLRLTFPQQTPTNGRQNMLKNMGEGVRYVSRQPVTRAFLMLGWVLPLLIIPTYSALPPIYAKEVYHGGPRTLGLLLSAVGVGGVAGGLFAASLGGVDRRGVVQLGGLFLLSLTLIGFALTTSLVVAVVMLALSGFFEMIYLTSNQTLLQLSIPDDLRGRVTSLVTLNMGMAPLGAVYAGTGADLIGPATVTVILSGLAAVIAVGTYCFSPTVRHYRLSRALAPSSSPHR
ncbi:MAG: MFS transporter [Chloroflexi bacterium]|nr:MFS transporter [Chloroflexota bacterium]